MRALLRLVLAVAVLGLLAAAVAQADHLDPQERFTRADQARARAMLLKRVDVAPSATQRPAGPPSHATCRALDESDLVHTGEAWSPEFGLGGVITFSSVAQVYRSAAQSATSWSRVTGAAGTACLRAEFRRGFERQAGVTLESFRSIPFPRIAQRTKAYRMVVSARLQGQTVRIYVDVIYFMHTRAQAGIFITSPIVVPHQKAEVRIARIVGGRMAKAMRGA